MCIEWISYLVEERSNRDKIVNGIPASAGEFPYMVCDYNWNFAILDWIRLDSFQAVLFLSGYLCGGTLIGPSHVLWQPLTV